MNVVQVNHAFDPAITSPQALLDRYHTLTGWSDAVRAAGCTVSVVQAFSHDAVERRNEVNYVFCRSGARSGAAGLAEAVCRCEPDVVHVNGFDAPWLVTRLRRRLPGDAAIVVQDHGGTMPRAMSPRSILACRALSAADGYLFTSREQSLPWVRRGAITDPAMAHEVLEASTHLTPIDRRAAREQTRMSGAPAVLWVGRLDANKDPFTVLAGFERALDALPAASLAMVFGSDDLLPAVATRLSASNRLRDRVRLVGPIEHRELAAWYSAADLFVLGSHIEAAGYALIEACACGAVPVVTGIAPFRAITGDGTIGHLWIPGDADSCALALGRGAMMVDEQARRDVRAHFAARLSWAAVGRRARLIYEVVLSRRGRRRGGSISAC
jgi:glycosyltransferase involved in cell wall biosynthesis